MAAVAMSSFPAISRGLTRAIKTNMNSRPIMTLLEFVAHNLQYGQKVSLTLKNRKEPIVCFFKGVRNWMGSRVGMPDRLIPVFTQVTKKGTRSSRELEQYTSLDEIISIQPYDTTLLPLEQIHSWWLGTRVAETIAENELKAIMKEIAEIFPGKRIPFKEEFNKGVSVMESHGGMDSEFPGTIVSLGVNDKGEFMFLQLDTNDNVDIYHESRVHVSNFSELLYYLVEAVMEPADKGEAPDYLVEEENVLFLSDYTHETLPKADPKKHPTLHGLQIIEVLRANLWWDGLSDSEKAKIAKEDGEHFTFWMKLYPNLFIPEDLSDIDKINLIWKVMPNNWKTYKYASSQSE